MFKLINKLFESLITNTYEAIIYLNEALITISSGVKSA